ncbi:hypothetical protein [Runella rosea]|uniref:hypothetical protein n=1 Tax=Runella rosea TaxID=2259595 RepID=UPI001E4567A3|nr:hypothetical protein [Runella rosea]
MPADLIAAVIMRQRYKQSILPFAAVLVFVPNPPTNPVCSPVHLTHAITVTP